MAIKIGQLAKLTGCQVVTIRYYEKEGLLAPPSRTQSGYRLYSAKDVERLIFVRHCRSHGMALEEIKALLKLQQRPDGDCSEVSQLVERHIDQVEEQIQSLTKLKEHLVKLRGQCPHGGLVSSCGIIKGLAAHELCSCPQTQESISSPDSRLSGH